LAERWRRWEAPIRIDQVNQALWLPDGRVLGEAEITWSPEQIERFRLGRKCANCLEPQEHAWPERCSLCGYPMRTHQAEFFAREFGGEGYVHRGPDLGEEMERLDEYRRKEEEARGNSRDQVVHQGRQESG